MDNKEKYEITSEKRYDDLDVVAIVNQYHSLLEMKRWLVDRPQATEEHFNRRWGRKHVDDMFNGIPENIANLFAERPFQLRDYIIGRLDK